MNVSADRQKWGVSGLRSRNNGCFTWVALIFALALVGRGFPGALLPLLIIFWLASVAAPAIRRSLEDAHGNMPSGTPRMDRQGPVIDLPPQPVSVEPAPAPLPTYSQPVSGDTLSLHLSFEAADVPSVAGLVAHFVGGQATIVSAEKRALAGSRCEYAYHLRGPESVLRELCLMLESRQVQNLTAFW